MNIKGKAVNKILAGERYLLLQGPMGPFFSFLSEWLEYHNREVINVVFNGGDRFYCKNRRFLTYLLKAREIAGWLDEVQQQYRFDTIICFGDCRPLHHYAKQWASENGVRILVFEEGYLRPQFITLEEDGVNANSSLSRDANFYLNQPDQLPLQVLPVKSCTKKQYAHAAWYYLNSWYYRKEFLNYQHHKPLSICYEAGCWIRSGWRKVIYSLKQRKILAKLQQELDKNYFLAILQVYNDSQVTSHSPYNDIRDYIYEVIFSFARHAPLESTLVIKHHPMDRGHRQYHSLIDQLCVQLGIRGRVMYVHDLPLPDLLNHAKGVVTINSTVGILALNYNKPLKVMGNALYDIKGLTFQDSLDKFWSMSELPDMKIFENFLSHLLISTQINSAYYPCLKKPDVGDAFFRVKDELKTDKEIRNGLNINL